MALRWAPWHPCPHIWETLSSKNKFQTKQMSIHLTEDSLGVLDLTTGFASSSSPRNF